MAIVLVIDDEEVVARMVERSLLGEYQVHWPITGLTL